jgi:hypothetical protein
LRALPTELYPAFAEVKRIVSRDGYIELAKAYYQAPAEYIGHALWVRYDGREVRLFNTYMELIIMHTRLEPGHYSRVRGVRGLDAAGSVHRTARYWQSRVARIGPAAGHWAERALEQRGAAAVRSLMGLCSLAKRHPTCQIDAACASAQATTSSNPTFRQIREQLASPATAQQATQQELCLQTATPIIRDLAIYGQFIEDQNQTQEPATQKTA